MALHHLEWNRDRLKIAFDDIDMVEDAFGLSCWMLHKAQSKAHKDHSDCKPMVDSIPLL